MIRIAQQIQLSRLSHNAKEHVLKAVRRLQLRRLLVRVLESTPDFAATNCIAQSGCWAL